MRQWRAEGLIVSCPTAPVFMSFLCLICRHYSAFFLSLFPSNTTEAFSNAFENARFYSRPPPAPAPCFLQPLRFIYTRYSIVENTARTARSEPRTASVTQHVNRSPSKGCLFPKTLRLGNSSNNITKHIILTEPAERQLQTEPQVLHTQDSGAGQGNT